MCEDKGRKTKIVCTIGPASESAQTLEALIRAGMNVARLNFSHGTHEEHLRKIATLRHIADRVGQPVAILQDLGGPKIRVGRMKEGGVELRRDQEFVLSTRDLPGDEQGVSVSYPTLAREVRAGDRILLADGTIDLEAIETGETDVRCRVVVGGVLTSFKGMNFPSRSILASAFTAKDQVDLLFGLQNGVDLVGLSYVKGAEDIEAVKQVLREHGADTPIIAKIERKEALEHLDAILAAADGVMVARGDLGMETPLERIPTVQKTIIRKANLLGKPVITATQMLRSMVDHTQPTRAEVTDVVNAVYDGTDAVMLSEETATGQFPVEAARMMARIALAAEEEFPHDRFLSREAGRSRELPQAISYAATALAEDVGAVAIVTPTESGSTARWVSRLRPRPPILALSRHVTTLRRLCLCWGVRPMPVSGWKDTDEMLEGSKQAARESGFASAGDRIVTIAGVPVGARGTTNLVKVETVE